MRSAARYLFGAAIAAASIFAAGHAIAAAVCLNVGFPL